MKVIFSEDLDIKKNQEIVENLNIHEVVKNIVNNGDPESNKSGTMQWESCDIYYAPLNGMVGTQLLGQIKMPDGTVLYESYSTQESKSDAFLYTISAISAISADNCRYTTQFRMGKWVDRFLKYSEDLSKQYQIELENKALEAREEKMKPFSEIDF